MAEIDKHYLHCIRNRLEQLYAEHPSDAELREAISDEVDWINDQLQESDQMTTDRERAIKAIRRGVPLGEVVMCSCHTDPPTRNGCFGVCEDAVAAIIASYEEIRREAAFPSTEHDATLPPQDERGAT